MKETMIQKNEMLMKEIEILRKEKDEVELKSKSDIEEVNSLRTSHSELKEELNKCLEEKVELEVTFSIWIFFFLLLCKQCFHNIKELQFCV